MKGEPFVHVCVFVRAHLLVCGFRGRETELSIYLKKKTKKNTKKKKTGKQRRIVPFHVKGKAELWYHLKDLLRNQNTERHTHTHALFFEKRHHRENK